MTKKLTIALAALLIFVFVLSGSAFGLSKDRYTNGEQYGVFFNNYDPNFYTGFTPRVQDKNRIKIHLGRGNQVRVRMVLPEETIVNYLPDQAARYSLYKEVIDKNIIQLTANMAWEDYQKRVEAEKLLDLAQKKSSYDDGQWRELNLEYMAKLCPDRLFHIQKDFDKMVETFAGVLAASGSVDKLQAKLDLVNTFFPHRIFAYNLTEQQDAALPGLISLAKAGDMAAFKPKAEAFFHDITDKIYPVENGKIDYWEFSAIYPAGTYDQTTTYKGQTIPVITTTGIWYMQPRTQGAGIVGMVDYISPRGYYGVMPWMPYQHAGGNLYNAFHNPGISNWIQGHPLLPKQWSNMTEGSRDGKPFLRSSITSRGPVSHGCTRLNPGHLSEMREMLPSTSDGMEKIVVYRNLSHCYDVFDIDGDGKEEVMGVQYYIAFRHTKSRVAKQIWAQNNRKDFYNWMYGDEMQFGPIGEVTFKEVYDGKFLKRKAVQGKKYENLKLFEAPYSPEGLQFYTLKGVDTFSEKGVGFNRELRRVGYGYTIDRKKLFLN